MTTITFIIICLAVAYSISSPVQSEQTVKPLTGISNINNNNNIRGSLECGGKITDSQGELNIPPNVNATKCIFYTGTDTHDLTLDTDGLFLSAQDSLVIESGDKKHTYIPPIDAGYLHIGGDFHSPQLTFILNSTRTNPMKIKYFSREILEINADINQNFKIINIGNSPNLEIKFFKSLNETIHIEITPPQVVKTFVNGHYLLNDADLGVYIDAKDTEILHLKTEIVQKSCSGIYTSQKGPQELSGPPNVTNPYQCVNLFKFDGAASPEAHFDLDFTNFIALADDNDELILKDTTKRIFIDKSSESSYVRKKISTSGRELVVIYRSPDGSKNVNPTGLKLTVVPQSLGGILLTEKDIQLPANVPVTYTLVPKASKCVSLKPLSSTLSDGKLTLSIDGSSSVFGPKINLPPVFGASQSKQMVLSYVGKTDVKLHFSPDGSCCNQLTADLSGRFSANGEQKDSCIWTIAAGQPVSINFDEIDLTPNGCVAIQSLDAKVPLYRRCNIEPAEVLPRFVVSQAYVNVSLPQKDTKFNAILSAASVKLSQLDGGIRSAGYPVSYPVVSGGEEVLTLNATNKNYLINLADVDLRTGETLKINSSEMSRLEDVIVSNSAINITITRPAIQTDFSLRRGLSIVTLPFNGISILSGNITGNNTVTLTNMTNSLIKISPPKASLKGPRVSYTISSSKPLELVIYDGPSIKNYNVKLTGNNSYNGSTTSNTAMLVVKSVPSLTITWWYETCNADDFICDNSIRCIPRELQCKAKYYCTDGSDMKISCNTTGPIPPPAPINTGVGGFTVFILCTMMLALGVLLSTFGPGLYRTLEDRIRGQGQYNSFTSVE